MTFLPMTFLLWLIHLKNVFVGNHDPLYGIDIIPYSINQTLKLLNQMEMDRDNVITIVQHRDLNVVPYLNLSIITFLLQNLYTTCLTHELIDTNLPFGFVCLKKLIRKTRGIYNT
jgi:hypothetical protein